jgi:hypothetical protein
VTPATSWFHAEGASGSFFSTFLLVSNPNDAWADVTLRFLLPNGETVTSFALIRPRQRFTVNPADVNPRLKNAAFSTVVTATQPVVSERAMYWAGEAPPFGEGHASSGVTGTATTWGLAEGRVGGPLGYATYILLANPQNTASEVTVTYLWETGAPVVKEYIVPADSRFNIDVGTDVPELQNHSFGARVAVTNGVEIAVERSLYWNVNGVLWAGGTNALATRIP